MYTCSKDINTKTNCFYVSACVNMPRLDSMIYFHSSQIVNTMYQDLNIGYIYSTYYTSLLASKRRIVHTCEYSYVLCILGECQRAEKCIITVCTVWGFPVWVTYMNIQKFGSCLLCLHLHAQCLSFVQLKANKFIEHQVCGYCIHTNACIHPLVNKSQPLFCSTGIGAKYSNIGNTFPFQHQVCVCPHSAEHALCVHRGILYHTYMHMRVLQMHCITT